MAILSSGQLVELRNSCERLAAVGWTKPQIAAVLQAIEDWFEANRASLVTALNTALAAQGLTLTAAQKRALVVAFFTQKATRE
jgi:hypothetical protein